MLFILMLGLVVIACLQMAGVSTGMSFVMSLVPGNYTRTLTNGSLDGRLPGPLPSTLTPPPSTPTSPPSKTSPPSTPPPQTASTEEIGGNKSCSFVSVDPFDPAVLKHVPKRNPLDCSTGKPSVVYLDGDSLRVNVSKLYRTLGHIDYSCFCQYTRLQLADENDSQLKEPTWSKRFSGQQAMNVSEKDEHMYVKCVSNGKIIAETFKSRVVNKPEMETTREADFKRHVKKHSPSDSPSILIVGMDGMSKQNFERTMPKTRSYILEHLHAKELNMFNKVGDNTFPNLIPLYTGLHDTQLSQYNWTNDVFFDTIDDLFVWHDYQQAGYRTSMNLDVTNIAVLHYLKKGWIRPPFDFYPRPLSLEMSSNDKRRSAGTNCIGDLPEVEILQDYTLQLVEKYNNTKTRPYFFYNFYTLLTHDYQEHGAMGDDIYLAFFQRLEQDNLLTNTILMFFSDHGNRFGPARQTFNGKIETSTPYVFFMFPPWFEKKYPEAMANFRTNQDRLTTFFDLHQTLKDLLTFTGTAGKASRRSRGIGLFDEIPADRSCPDADIPMEYCNCKQFSTAKVGPNVSTLLSSHLLRHIVGITATWRDSCAALSLKSVKSIMTITTNGVAEETVVLYLMVVETTPGGALYEVLMQHDTDTGTVAISGKIVRLNLYKGQDGCVESLDLKPYCFCKG